LPHPQDTIAGNPTTKNCTIAHWSYQYDEFTGDPNEYLQWQVNTYYSKTTIGNKWGWVGGECHKALCYCAGCEA
jgi:hypothetical protein